MQGTKATLSRANSVAKVEKKIPNEFFRSLREMRNFRQMILYGPYESPIRILVLKTKNNLKEILDKSSAKI